MNSASEALAEDLPDTPKALSLASTPRSLLANLGRGLLLAPPSCTFLPARFPPGIMAGAGPPHAAVAGAPAQDA